MADPVGFKDYDDSDVFSEAQSNAVNPKTLNFVVEFGPKSARIAWDVDHTGFKKLLRPGDEQRRETPVRWINIWTPHVQKDSVDAIAKCYGFSDRLRAILRTGPNIPSVTQQAPAIIQTPINQTSRDDIEMGHTPTLNGKIPKAPSKAALNHYDLARTLINYQSFDTTDQFICVGANWMHQLDSPTQFCDDEELATERRLWSWLVICKDHTVISFHEPHGLVYPNSNLLGQLRSHTLNVLQQLSTSTPDMSLSLSLISVRQNLKDDGKMNVGSEGASNLFYYLFDDWHATYKKLTSVFQDGLEEISSRILSGLDGRKRHENGAEIIKDLYKIGAQMRMNRHLYKGYKSLVGRVIKPGNHDLQPVEGMPTPNQHLGNDRITLAPSAMNRFERLGDRIELIMLSSIEQSIGEKDALTNTYFNIIAQIDSRATAKLNKNAAILSKLGVVFLPVSLMTGYFSVQIDDLQGVYSYKTYWACFGVVVGLSILVMFFLNSVLLRLSDKLRDTTKHAKKWFPLKNKQV